MNETPPNMSNPTPYRLMSCLVFVLCLLCAPAVMAQDSLVVYSDTSDVAYATDSLITIDTMIPDSTVWLPSIDGSDHGFGFLSWMAGLTGVLFVLMLLLIIGLPIAVVALIIYLIYRLRRERQLRRELAGRQAGENGTAIYIDHRQRAIERACWGVGLIAVEYIIDFSTLLYIGGVILLCMALSDLLKWLTRNKN